MPTSNKNSLNIVKRRKLVETRQQRRIDVLAALKLSRIRHIMQRHQRPINVHASP